MYLVAVKLYVGSSCEIVEYVALNEHVTSATGRIVWGRAGPEAAAAANWFAGISGEVTLHYALLFFVLSIQLKMLWLRLLTCNNEILAKQLWRAAQIPPRRCGATRARATFLRHRRRADTPVHLLRHFLLASHLIFCTILSMHHSAHIKIMETTNLSSLQYCSIWVFQCVNWTWTLFVYRQSVCAMLKRSAWQTCPPLTTAKTQIVTHDNWTGFASPIDRAGDIFGIISLIDFFNAKIPFHKDKFRSIAPINLNALTIGNSDIVPTNVW